MIGWLKLRPSRLSLGLYVEGSGEWWLGYECDLCRPKYLPHVTILVTLYCMIISFKHNGLKWFFESGTTRGIQANQAARIRLILARLNASVDARDMMLPGLHLHELTGNREGTWSVRVSGNWRVTFRFEGPDACDVNLEDYH